MTFTYANAATKAAEIVRFHLGDRLWERIELGQRNQYVSRALRDIWQHIEERDRSEKP